MAFKVQVGSPQISIHQDQTILTTDLDRQINGRSERPVEIAGLRADAHFWTNLASLRLGCVFLGTLGPAVRVRGMLGRFEECAECERK
jgi:hypothetical protein